MPTYEENAFGDVVKHESIKERAGHIIHGTVTAPVEAKRRIEHKIENYNRPQREFKVEQLKSKNALEAAKAEQAEYRTKQAKADTASEERIAAKEERQAKNTLNRIKIHNEFVASANKEFEFEKKRRKELPAQSQPTQRRFNPIFDIGFGRGVNPAVFDASMVVSGGQPHNNFGINVSNPRVQEQRGQVRVIEPKIHIKNAPTRLRMNTGLEGYNIPDSMELFTGKKRRR